METGDPSSPFTTTSIAKVRRAGPTCAGAARAQHPHIPRTRSVFMRTAAVYWLSDENNQQLQHLRQRLAAQGRFEGVSALLWRRRRRGATTANPARSLTCSSFPEEIGSGLAVFHPKGGIVRTVMWRTTRGNAILPPDTSSSTHHVTKAALFEKVRAPRLVRLRACIRRWIMDHAQYYLKPMNCLMHNLIYSARGRSHRELPRLFEFGTVHRHEKSGVVQGIDAPAGSPRTMRATSTAPVNRCPPNSIVC